MAIDLRNVEPLASKSRLGGRQESLLEQALKRGATRTTGSSKFHDDMDFDEDMPPVSSRAKHDLAWIQQDKAALQNLVQQMDATMSDLNRQLQQVKVQSLQSRSEIENEQKLLFKQIHTLNSLLKKQVDLFSVMERKVQALDIKRGPVMQQAAVGVIAGLVSAVSLVVLSPLAATFLKSMM